MNAPVHAEGMGNWTKSIHQLSFRQVEAILRKADPHEECSIMQARGMLVRLEDIPTMLKDKLGNTRNNSWLIWTRDQQRNHFILYTHVKVFSFRSEEHTSELQS